MARIGADELQQVLINLALNARDAMPDGGRLSFTTASERLDGARAAELGVSAGDYVSIEVADTGQGIAREHLDRIFEPFFTTKELGKGTGLGLSVVHGVVRGAGGAVCVDSVVGRGTRFSLWLPATERTASVVRTPLPMADGLRVLLVDDDPIVLDVVGTMIEACGCSATRFSDPDEACAWFAAHALAIDVAVLDGNMPRLSGWQVAARLIELRPDLPVIALTGAATPDAREEWRTAGVPRVLAKPVTREVLTAVFAEIRRPDAPAPQPPPSAP
jgi:CheY-like chemotaxis protein